MNLFELEKKMLPKSRWGEAPSYIRGKMNEVAEIVGTGVPIGVGYDRQLGWFVMTLDSQQPRLEWSENPAPPSDF